MIIAQNFFRHFLLSLSTVVLLLVSGDLQGQNDPALFRVNASGQDGQNAQSGRDADQNRPGHDRSGNGLPGRSGGDASVPTPGLDAWDVRLEVWQEGNDAAEQMIRVRGEMIQGSRSNPINEQRIRVSEVGEILVIAQGGAGGSGGAAGRGQPGGNAEGRGADARPASGPGRGPEPAEPGRDGGDAGDAGRASDGAPGGRGGRIQFILREGQEHLASLISLDPRLVAGGPGGKAGASVNSQNSAEGGKPTEGGNGLFEMPVEFHDRANNKTYRGRATLPRPPRAGQVGMTTTRARLTNVADSSDVIEKEVQVPYRMEDGPDGRPGRAGRPSPGTTRSGGTGGSGNFEIVVKTTDGRELGRYQSKFQPKLVDMVVIEQDPNRVVEPGEQIQIDLVVGNTQLPGTAQLPVPNSQFELRIESPPFDQGPLAGVQVPAIPAGQTATLRSGLIQIQPMNFNERTQEGVDVLLAVNGFIPALGRRLDALKGQKTIRVGLDVKFHGMRGLRNLRPGEAAWFEMLFENRSEKALDIQRELLALLQLEGGLSPEQIVLVDQDGQRIEFSPGSPWIQKLPSIPAKGSLVVKVGLGIRSGSPSDQIVRMIPSMQRQMLNGTGMSQVSHQPFEVTIGDAYQFDASADLVFVTGKSLSTTEIAHLQTQAGSLGLKSSVYRLSSEVIFDLMRSNGSNQQLREALRGKTVVLVEPESAFQPKDFLDAAAMGVNFLIISSQAQDLDLMRVLGRAQLERGSAKEFEELEELMTELAKSSGQASAQAITFIPSYRTVIVEPSEERMQKEARELIATLQARFPGQRFEVFYHFDPKKKGGWLRPVWQLGTLKIVRTLEAGAGRVVAYQSANAKNPSLDQNFSQAMLRSLHFDQAIEAYRRLSASDPRMAAFVFEGLVIRLMGEVSGASLKSPESRARLEASLGKLLMLANQSFSAPQGDLDRVVTEGLSWLMTFALMNERSGFASEYKAFWEKLVKAFYGSAAPWDSLRRRATSILRDSRADNGTELFEAFRRQQGLPACQGDWACFTNPEEQLFNESVLEARSREAAARQSQLENLRRAEDQERSKYLIPGGCDALLGQSGRLASN